MDALRARVERRAFGGGQVRFHAEVVHVDVGLRHGFSLAREDQGHSIGQLSVGSDDSLGGGESRPVEGTTYGGELAQRLSRYGL